MSTTETGHASHLHHGPLSRNADIPGVAIQVSRDIVVASIQVDLDEEVLARFREDLLCRVHESGSRGVILDVSGLEILDSEEFSALRGIIKMIGIMGAESVLVGLRPGVVSALIQAGVEVDGLRSAIDLDAAYALLQSLLEPEPEPEPESAPEALAETDVRGEDYPSRASDQSPGGGP